MPQRILAACSILLFMITTVAPLTVRAEGSALTKVRVADNVYALVGPLTQRDRDNLGNNATFGFIVTKTGVVLIDPGGSAKGAAAIAEQIRTVTKQPVKWVINTGGQDHRWLGNGYFRERGAEIIAAAAAVADQKERANDQLLVLEALIGDDNLVGTDTVFASRTFDQRLELTLGGEAFELSMAGPAHTPGDTLVWMPERKVLFSGDIVYLERMLGVGGQSDSNGWLEAFSAVERLAPEIIVPGHGRPAGLAEARAQTRDYLVFLRRAVGDLIDAGGTLADVGTIDQSRFSHLAVSDQIAGRNAHQVFQVMEWE